MVSPEDETYHQIVDETAADVVRALIAVPDGDARGMTEARRVLA